MGILLIIYKFKFKNILDPISDILFNLRLIKSEIKKKLLIINILIPPKNFYIIDVLGVSYFNFINTNFTAKNELDIKNNFS